MQKGQESEVSLQVPKPPHLLRRANVRLQGTWGCLGRTLVGELIKVRFGGVMREAAAVIDDPKVG